jgi:hypothetical protein
MVRVVNECIDGRKLYLKCARVSGRVTITKIHLYLFPVR